jgi:lipoprotein-anchoring transpeptidase ErfK/SrfK
MLAKFLPLLFLLVAALPSGASPLSTSPQPLILVSVPEQKMVLIENGRRVAAYPVSTSRYGLGDRFGSYATPPGRMEVAQKIGAGAPLGSVFKSRRRTGEVLSPNAPGRDPIVTRILWLRGLDPQNRNAFARKIYIHGTPQEKLIGRPASYGCIRMRSRDVAELFNRVGVGAQVKISNGSIRQGISMLRRS